MTPINVKEQNVFLSLNRQGKTLGILSLQFLTDLYAYSLFLPPCIIFTKDHFGVGVYRGTGPSYNFIC